MKYVQLSICSLTLMATLSFTRQNQQFRVFNTNLKASDVVGNKKFNDLGLSYYTDVINNLTDDTTSYLWRLGSVRLNVKNYTQGTMSLFDLSTANHTGGYPLLDQIDLTFYKERGFQLLESKDPSLLRNAAYSAFKTMICNESVLLSTRRAFLWQDDHKAYRDRLLLTRYFINVQPITLEQKLVKKVVKDISVGLRSDINALLTMAHSLKDTTNQQPIDTLGLRAYFQKDVDRTLNLRGNYISVVLQDQYVKRAQYEIARLTSTDELVAADNEFNNNLKKYIGVDTVAFNSALFAFKLSGGLDRTVVSADSIRGDLKTLFNMGAKQAASLALTASFMFSKRLEETFKNQFAKVWIIMFGTDEIMNSLSFRNIKPVDLRKNNGKEVKNQQQY